MVKKLYTLDFSYLWTLLIAFTFSVLCLDATAQAPKSRRPARARTDTTARALPHPESAPADSVSPASPKVISPNAISSTVEYSAKDSVVNDLQNRYTYLFGDAVVKYEDMELRADYIEIDFKNSELYASGVADSTGRLHGTPVFIQTDADREIRIAFDSGIDRRFQDRPVHRIFHDDPDPDDKPENGFIAI